MSTRGAVAAGHRLTAEAGTAVLRDGGNAVDAAVAAVLTSFVVESPLTGLGAGGYMLVHEGGDNVVLDFFVEVPGRDGPERGAELIPVPVYFTEDVPQIFNCGAASCGVPGTAAGLEEALRRFGSVPLGHLAAPASRHAREGVVVNPEQAFIFKILEPILTMTPESAAVYAPEGRILDEGDAFRWPDLGDALERLGAEGAAPFYRGDVAARLAEWVAERGGTLGVADLAAYEVVGREPVRASFQGREALTNPPPSSGGILIAYGLEVLERLGETGIEHVVAAMEEAQAARTEEFVDGLYEPDFAAGFLDRASLDQAADRARRLLRPPATRRADPGDGLGSTTHITAVDGEGRCASVTCSNGTGSGLIVPGTGIHVNNMLGEEDLNPHGFHRLAAGVRMPSMMSPTVLLRQGQIEAGLGSGGSNRIRSAVLQAIVRIVAEGMDAQRAVAAPRIHFEAGAVQAEPGIDPEALRRIEARGIRVDRWEQHNLFFGGVHAVVRDPETGELRGGGDPRRGGAVALA
jgi:gamma-glutamyltranspeptidase/glutathione hydrolase